MSTKKRTAEMIRLLNMVVDDLQMLAVSDTDYEVAFQDSVALLTYIEAINSTSGPTSPPVPQPTQLQ